MSSREVTVSLIFRDKSLRDIDALEKGDVLTTKLNKGLITSRVEDLRDE